jgi:hypothetical protein
MHKKDVLYWYLESYRACPIPRPRGKRGVVLLVQAGALPRCAACVPEMKKYFLQKINFSDKNLSNESSKLRIGN